MSHYNEQLGTFSIRDANLARRSAPLRAVSVTIPEGHPLLLRPLRADDAPRLRNLYSRLSPRSLYLRFASPRETLTPQQVEQLTRIDVPRELAFVALLRPGPTDSLDPMQTATPPGSSHAGETDALRLVGEARLYSTPGGDLAEFSVLIEDQWQGRGVGAELLRHLIKVSRALRFRRLWGLVLTENIRMIRLGRALGARILADPGDPQVEMIIPIDRDLDC